MASILVNIRSMSITSGFEYPTAATIELVIKDRPQNADQHLRLLGKLAVATLVMSDDEDKFSISILEKEEQNG